VKVVDHNESYILVPFVLFNGKLFLRNSIKLIKYWLLWTDTNQNYINLSTLV